MNAPTGAGNFASDRSRNNEKMLLICLNEYTNLTFVRNVTEYALGNCLAHRIMVA